MNGVNNLKIASNLKKKKKKAYTFISRYFKYKDENMSNKGLSVGINLTQIFKVSPKVLKYNS